MAWLLRGWWWWLLGLVIICHHGTNKRARTSIPRREKNEFWIFFWWPLQSQAVGGWLGVTYLSVLLVCVPLGFIRFISVGHWGWPGCVASLHELWNQPTFFRWGLWFIQLCGESTVLLRHHQGERHVWVLLWLVSTLLMFDGLLLNPHACLFPQLYLNFSVCHYYTYL